MFFKRAIIEKVNFNAPQLYKLIPKEYIKKKKKRKTDLPAALPEGMGIVRELPMAFVF